MSVPNKLLVIRSADRISGGTSESCIVQMQENIQGRYRVKNIVIPNCMYPVRSTNNKVYFSQSGTNRIATITPGFYTSATFITALDAALNASTPAPAGVFSTTYSASTGKITINNSTTAFILQFGTFSSLSSYSARKLMGFEATDSASAMTQTGTNVINLTPDLGISINLNTEGGVKNLSTGASFSIYIPIQPGSSAFGSLISLDAKNLEYTINLKNNDNKIQMQVCDSGSQPISLNGADYEIMLEKLN